MLDLKIGALALGTTLGALSLGAMPLAASSCTVIYDTDVFVDADAAVVIEPTELVLEAVEPASVFEGQGASDESRAIPIIVRGRNIAPGARLIIVGAGIDLDVEAQTSADGTMAATEIRVPVDTELGAGSSLPVSVTLRQVGAEQTVSFDVKGLDELTELAGVVDSATLAPRYSRIELNEPVEFVGSSIARLVATDSIHVASALRADGRDDGQRSAGGFLGGLPEQNGGGTSGGTSGGPSAGGGGGGNLEMGGSGQGSGSGIGGPAVEAAFLFPLDKVVGYGGGGGGGSASAGSGGAGGGAIELRAGGTLTLAEGAIVSANGRDGGQGSSCTLLAVNGGGGGGSGGALLLRSATTILVAEDVVTSVAGGSGGTSSGNCKGGDGAPGRVRVDSPQIDTTLSATVTGPSFVLDRAPAVVTASTTSIAIAGGIGSTYFLKVNARTAETITLSDAIEDVSLALSPGLNQVCALVNLDGNQGQPESLNCVSIAYLPSP